VTIISAYLKELEHALQAGNATEHTHRPALKTLIEALAQEHHFNVTATNEPKRGPRSSPSSTA